MSTYNDLVKKHFPGVTDEDCDTLLWNCTAFPFCDVNHTIKQLNDIYIRSNGDVNIAVALAHKDLENEMKEVNELESNAKKNINLTYHNNNFVLWLNGISHELNHFEMARLQDLCQQSYLLKNKVE